MQPGLPPSPPGVAMKALRRLKLRGFTLLELLVAISILAIIALIAWRGLDSLVTTRARLEPEADNARALIACFGQLELDAAQIASPTMFALRVRPVQVLVGDTGTALIFTRIAPQQPDRATSLQQITYEIADGVLVRRATPPTRVNDPTVEVSPELIETAHLLTGVTALHVRVWQVNQGWVPPAQEAASLQQSQALPGLAAPPPPGIEIVITRDGRDYRRVLLVG
jgi:general secretion pathway protein J